jgi:predicted ABC-type ATPase
LAALCTILGGPNGSGKSSLYRALAPPGEFVNADMIARHLNPADPASASLLAGRTVLRRLSALIGQRRDFVWETTLSSNQALALMRRAHTAGYEIGLVFVVLARAELNVDRVAQRVSQGGHHIPEDIVRRRYDAALEKLADAIPLAHATAIFDNTERVPALLLRIAGHNIEENRLDAAQPLHARICKAVADAWDMSVEAVLRSGRSA